ncbi:SH3 domain-containing protein [Planomonospora sp. ID82291]|uniref:SH3 domain-containing protein n=1 Tax=Planomonospora sp. ID82291 TaxID=2738136 RepID=UPI0018C3E9B1|nr:SH3 domain-containing protein [Planomonospora sp. ID82291]MBG0813912.1 SH3 domain-containing protein [Planomonospora sp. ID82291]
MVFKRLAGTFAAAAIASGGLVALSTAAATPAQAEKVCAYKVRNVPSGSYLNVHRKPSKSSKVVDRIDPRYAVVGQCKLATTNWRLVQGHKTITTGYVHKSYLKKVLKVTVP